MVSAAWRRLRFQVMVNLYPPFLGAGVRVHRVAEEAISPRFLSIRWSATLTP